MCGDFVFGSCFFMPNFDVNNILFKYKLSKIQTNHIQKHKFERDTEISHRLTRVILYVRRIGLYLYKYRIYGTITIYFLKGLAFIYQLV